MLPGHWYSGHVRDSGAPGSRLAPCRDRDRGDPALRAADHACSPRRVARRNHAERHAVLGFSDDRSRRVLEALSGAYLLRNAIGLPEGPRASQRYSVFLLFGVGIAPMIGATVGTVAFCTGGAVPWADAGRLWRIWWLGDAMGTLIIGALLLAWSLRFERTGTFARIAEVAGLFAVLSFVVAIVHAGVFEPDLVAPLSFLAFPFVIWAALAVRTERGHGCGRCCGRLRPLGCLHGEGPFAEPRFAVAIVFFYGYTASLALTGLLLAASTTERRPSAEELRRIGQDLDIRVRERTADLQEELVRRRRAQEELQIGVAECENAERAPPHLCVVQEDQGRRGVLDAGGTVSDRAHQAQFSHGLCPDCFSHAVSGIRRQV